jgi:hypothetical protein
MNTRAYVSTPSGYTWRDLVAANKEFGVSALEHWTSELEQWKATKRLCTEHQ